MLVQFEPFRVLDHLAQAVASGARASVMPMDAYRHGDDLVVHIDLPGVGPGSIEVTVEKNVLTVSAQRNWQPAEDDEVIASERPRGSFTRQLFVGQDVDTDRVHASYEHGVLTLTIPVTEKAEPRRIEVDTGDNNRAISAGTGASAN